jgi:hypothetical protein
LALVLLFAGCAAPTPKPIRFCPGKQTASEAIEALNLRSQQVMPVRASGQCLLRYRLEGKSRKENFPVKLWVNPPGEVYLQGDVAFDATGLVFGSNSDEFWFWLKPKEISSYWWGRWTQADDLRGLALSPSAVLDAFGAVKLRNGDWSLTHGQYDILWLHNAQGDLRERIFIEPCDYVVSKIEYFNSSGVIAASAEFSEYKKIADGFFTPQLIKITAFAEDDIKNSVEISLSSINLVRLNEQQRQRLFVRPGPQGFEHIYQIIKGRTIEQKGD